ncbi:MAG: hypothetical protein IT181_12960 [Acidobacteria bacterium]|nr:hypothetical protein [Acidobacteriota bacterium]
MDAQVRERYGTAQALSMRIGLSLSAFTRGVTAGSLSTESLLRLALETGTAASDLLRIAKKEHVAHLIEQLYGKSAPQPGGDIRTLAEAWPSLPPAAQQAVLVLVRAVAKQHASAKRKTA